MNGRLFGQAVARFLAGVLLVALLLFVPAGTIRWRNGWLLMGLLFVPMFLAGAVMMAKSPQLLRKRLSVKEAESEQRAVVSRSGAMFLIGFVLAGLNHRFGWTVLPRGIVIAASILFLLSDLLYAEVLRENAYLSRTIEVQQGQKVIDTGLYGIVRHPMYAATIVLFLSMPLILGSPLSLAVFLVYPVIIARRIRNEEQVLTAGLEGYADYTRRVKYRVLPGIW